MTRDVRPRVDRRVLQQALQQGQQISRAAASGQGFDPRGGVGVLAAQLATAGIGAFQQNRARKELAELEQQELSDFEAKFPQFAGLNLSKETRDATKQAFIKKALEGPQTPKRQIIETATGFFSVDPQTGESIPVTTAPKEDRLIGGATDDGDLLTPEQLKAPEKDKGLDLTKGQEATDKKFAEEFVDFEARGGFSDVEKQLNQLREVRRSLNDIVKGRSKKDLTGPRFGLTPDTVMAFTNPEALSTKQKVEEVVQRNLRLILGAQFTEKEGERLISRAYDERLSESENLKRVDALIKQINQAAKSKRSAARYFQKFGTLKGWKGREPEFKGLPGDKEEEEVEEQTILQQEAAPKVRRFNPQTGRIE